VNRLGDEPSDRDGVLELRAVEHEPRCNLAQLRPLGRDGYRATQTTSELSEHDAADGEIKPDEHGKRLQPTRDRERNLSCRRVKNRAGERAGDEVKPGGL